MGLDPSLTVTDEGRLAYLGSGLQINHFSSGTPESIAKLAPPTAPPDPSEPSAFLGRQDDFDAVFTSLVEDGSEGVWLEGETGVGKSELARHVAHSLIRCGVKVWWVRATDGQSMLASLVSIAYQAGARELDFRFMNPADVLWTALGGMRQDWVIILDDWANPYSDQFGEVGAGWIRRPGRQGHFLFTAVSAPSPGFGWLRRRILDSIGLSAAAELLLGLAPNAGTRAEAEQLAAALHRNATALMGAGRYLHDVERTPILGSVLPRSFAEYARAFREVVEQDLAHEIFPFVAVLERSLELLEAQGSVTARPLASLISVMPEEPIPSSLLVMSHLHPSLSGRHSWDFERALAAMDRLKLLEISSDSSCETVAMHGLFRAARQLVQRTEGEIMTSLDVAIAMLEHWTEHHPAHAPQEWHAWRAISPHLRNIGVGLDEAWGDNRRRHRIQELQRRAAEFHYLAGQYEVAEEISRLLLARLSTDDSLEDRIWVLANVLFARIRREQGHATEARILLQSIEKFAVDRLGERHPATRETRLGIARTMREEGSLKGSLDKLETQIDLNIGFPNRDAPFDVNLTDWALLLNVGRCYRDLGLPERALEITNALYISWDSWCTRESLHFVDMQYEHAENLAAAGQREEAARIHILNLQVARRLLGEEHLNVLLLEVSLLEANYLDLLDSALKAERWRLHGVIVEKFGDEHPLAIRVRGITA